MKPKNQWKSKSEGSASRKTPLTIPYIVGMLESSAHLDTRGSARRQEEASTAGRASGHQKLHGKSYQVIELPHNSYSLGITLSAQVLAGQAAELALKYVYEREHRDEPAPTTHRLDYLYSLLSDGMKKRIEEDYSIRKPNPMTQRPVVCFDETSTQLAETRAPCHPGRDAPSGRTTSTGG